MAYDRRQKITDTVQSVFTSYNASNILIMHRPCRVPGNNSVLCTLANLLIN